MYAEFPQHSRQSQEKTPRPAAGYAGRCVFELHIPRSKVVCRPICHGRASGSVAGKRCPANQSGGSAVIAPLLSESYFQFDQAWFDPRKTAASQANLTGGSHQRPSFVPRFYYPSGTGLVKKRHSRFPARVKVYWQPKFGCADFENLNPAQASICVAADSSLGATAMPGMKIEELPA